jgi:hypothetical protein
MIARAGVGAPPQYQYSPTADPNWVIRCERNQNGDYNLNCQRIPASQVPVGGVHAGAIRSFLHPRSKTLYRFGRKRPVARCPRLSLKNSLMKGIPSPPAKCDYSTKASAALSQVYLNNSLGDCVIAGMAHVVGVLTGNAGSKPVIYTNQQIIALYGAIGGYKPGVPSTDQGCDEQTALNFWENDGAPIGSTHKIAGWMSIDGTNPEEFRTALWLFENLYFGLELPDTWVNPTPSRSGFVWDTAGQPDPNNGHCVVGVGYNAKGVTIATWGMTGLMTNAAIAKYATMAGGGELYAVISQDGINKAVQKAPTGFDWSQLVADFDSMSGRPPTPVTQTSKGRKRSGSRRRK